MAAEPGDRVQPPEGSRGVALVIGKLRAKTVGVQGGLALRRRHIAKIPEGAGYEPPPIDRKCAKLMHGSKRSTCPALRRTQVFHGLVMLNDPAALLWRQAIEVAEPINMYCCV